VKIDGSLYPDRDPPIDLRTIGDRVDCLHRLCAAWDFGILPDPEAIQEIRAAGWREAVDRCRFQTSPSYHLLREWHGLERIAFLGRVPAHIASDPSFGFV
jgi:hypothetical protein